METEFESDTQDAAPSRSAAELWECCLSLFPYVNIFLLSPIFIWVGLPVAAIVSLLLSLFVIARYFGGFILLPLVLGTFAIVIKAVLTIVR